MIKGIIPSREEYTEKMEPISLESAIFDVTARAITDGRSLSNPKLVANHIIHVLSLLAIPKR